MCILFLYNGAEDESSDYSLILASNRDEYYDRPSQTMMQWLEDPNVIGGRDLEALNGGTWLAVSPLRKKLGVLLNLPTHTKDCAKSRGRIIADFVKSEITMDNYIEHIKDYTRDCNGFVFVAVDMSNIKPSVFSYSNATEALSQHSDSYLGFGNCLPGTPLKKVEAGTNKLQDICTQYKKIADEKELVKELLGLLKSEQRYLPDPQLESRRPNNYEELSSVYVRIMEARYGTRTHSIVLLTKSGHLTVIEDTKESPIDPLKPSWHKTQFHYNINE